MIKMVQRFHLRTVPMVAGLSTAAALLTAAALAGAGFMLAGPGSRVCVAQRYEPPPPPLKVDPCAVKQNPKFPVTPNPKAKPLVCPPPSSAAKPDAAAPDAAGTGDAKPSPAQRFPFPGEAGSSAAGAGAAKPSGTSSAADKFPYPGSTPAPAASPATPAAGRPADQFPYPGETSKSPDAAPEGDTPRYVPDSPGTDSGSPGVGGNAPTSKPDSAGDSSSSSSSSSSGSSSNTNAAPAPSSDRDTAGIPDDGSATKSANRGRRPLPKVSAQSADERVTEDLNVANFYSGHGNFEAAYLRSRDAVTVMPSDPESHFALAQAAEKLRKKDEAIAEYNLYLKLDPAGDHTSIAQKALSGLQ